MIRLEEIPELRDRLRARRLTDSDINNLDQHLASFQGTYQPVDPSRKVVASLPGGLDLVK